MRWDDVPHAQSHTQGSPISDLDDDELSEGSGPGFGLPPWPPGEDHEPW